MVKDGGTNARKNLRVRSDHANRGCAGSGSPPLKISQSQDHQPRHRRDYERIDIRVHSPPLRAWPPVVVDCDYGGHVKRNSQQREDYRSAVILASPYSIGG
jgi:hypothetical protein